MIFASLLENLMKDARFVSRLTRNTMALILAGGRGSRLLQLTDDRAKPAVPFGGKFRIIDFPLSNCINSHIRRVAVLTQYKAHTLIKHLQRGWGFLRGEFNEFVEIWPAQQRIQEEWYKGTADAIYQNLDIIQQHMPDYVLVLAGDHIYKMDYGNMLAFHVQRNADLTIGCIPVAIDQAKAFGVMAIDEAQRITAFAEKPKTPQAMPNDPTRALASMGIYIFNRDYLIEKLKKDSENSLSEHDFGKNIIPQAIGTDQVFAFPFVETRQRQIDEDPQGRAIHSAEKQPAYWRDVGTIDAFWESNLELIGVVPELNLYDEEWPIWTYQEQLPPAKFVFDDEDRRGMAVDSMVSGGCIISGSSVRHSLLFSSVRVNSYSLLQDSVILPNCTIGRYCEVHKAVLDEGVTLPDGTIIGKNRAEDARRFTVSDGGVVLVTQKMLNALK
jgi:glucose-1-phosphate adenylyltransferase